MSKPIRVFISGTHEDLLDERRIVRDVLAHLQLSCVTMEVFGADSRPPIETCLSNLRGCELVILLVGEMYGSTVPERGDKSYTELEYDEALNDPGILVHAYIRRSDVAILPRFVESDGQKREKLRAFKDRLCSSRHCHYYSNQIDLAIRVTADVSHHLADLAHAAEQERLKRKTPALVSSEAESAAVSNHERQALVYRHYGEVSVGIQRLLLDSFRVVIADNPDDLRAKLTPDLLLILPGPGYEGQPNMNEQDVATIVDFIKEGGKLLCMGLAWSWAYKEYGNKPVEQYPLNTLGRVMDFTITGRNIGNPATGTLHDRVKEKVSLIRRDGWAASQIDSSSGIPLVRDEQNRPMAVYVNFGEGRVIVVGHTAMLDQNPDLLKAFIDILETGLGESKAAASQ